MLAFPMHYRTLILGIVCAALFGCPSGQKGTAPGVVFDYQPPGPLSVSDWSVGEATGTAQVDTRRFLIEPPGGDKIAIALTVTRGPMRFVEKAPSSNAPKTVLAPQGIKVELTENSGGWTVTGDCADELRVALAVNEDGTSAYPTEVWASCDVKLKRGDSDTGPFFEVHGDGTINTHFTGGQIGLILEDT